MTIIYMQRILETVENENPVVLLKSVTFIDELYVQKIKTNKKNEYRLASCELQSFKYSEVISLNIKCKIPYITSLAINNTTMPFYQQSRLLFIIFNKSVSILILFYYILSWHGPVGGDNTVNRFKSPLKVDSSTTIYATV